MRYASCVFGVIFTFVLVVETNADLVWQRMYECTKIPQEPGSILLAEGGTSEWTEYITGTQEDVYVHDGILHYSFPHRNDRYNFEVGTHSTADGDSRWDASGQTTWEMRAQMVQDGEGAGLDFYLADGDYYYRLQFGLDYAKAPASGGATIPVDLASDFFTVRVAIDGPTNTMNAYFIDANSDEVTLNVPAVGELERNNLSFGIVLAQNVPAEMEIDYMRWTHEGAYDFTTEINMPDQGNLPGDLNSDGFVGGDDLDIVRSFWGQNVTAGDLLQGDPSNDGFVGGDDLDIVRANWGQGTPPAPSAVPEPSMIALLLGALVTIGIARRC